MLLLIIERLHALISAVKRKRKRPSGLAVE
jgi:hypothetical protein